MSHNKRKSPLCLGIMASHTGTNFQSILDRCLTGEISAQVGVVVSNNSRAGVLERARRFDIPTAHLSLATHPKQNALDEAITNTLQAHRVDLIVLAGYMKKLGRKLLSEYRNRIINVHPSLLPSFGGKGMYGQRVHEAVLRSGCEVTGVTVHVVDGEYDHGPIIAQASVPVFDGDTSDTLSRRVLEMEHRLYPNVVRHIANGQIVIGDDGVKKCI